jgi:hypothetical protein
MTENPASLTNSLSALASTGVSHGARGTSSSATVEQVLLVLHRFSSAARELRSRGENRSSFVVRDDIDVRDLAFALLKPLVPDLERQNQTSTGGPTDLASESLGLVIDVKSTLVSGRERTVIAECHDRVQRITAFPGLRHLAFFVYDPDQFLADRETISARLSGPHTRAGSGFLVHVAGPGFPHPDRAVHGASPKFAAEAPSDQEAMNRLLAHVGTMIRGPVPPPTLQLPFAETDLLLRLRLGTTKRLIKATLGNRYQTAEETEDGVTFRDPTPSIAARDY